MLCIQHTQKYLYLQARERQKRNNNLVKHFANKIYL